MAPGRVNRTIDTDHLEADKVRASATQGGPMSESIVPSAAMDRAAIERWEVEARRGLALDEKFMGTRPGIFLVRSQTMVSR